MAITFVGSGENGFGSTSDLPITLPAMEPGDAVYVFVICADPGDLAMNTAGYTEIVTDIAAGAGEVAVFRKIQTDPVDTDASVDITATLTGRAAVAIVLRGVDQTTPEDATPTTAAATSTNPDPPSITTVTAGAWVIAFAGSQGIVDTSITAPSGYGNQVDAVGDHATQAANDCTAGGATREIASAGAENPAAWTNWSSGGWRALSIAVRPAPPSGQPYYKRTGGVRFMGHGHQHVDGRRMWRKSCHETLSRLTPASRPRRRPTSC